MDFHLDVRFGHTIDLGNFLVREITTGYQGQDVRLFRSNLAMALSILLPFSSRIRAGSRSGILSCRSSPKKGSLALQLVMINLVPSGADRLRFEVNKSNLLNQGLKPLPELILNGGTEIDVAKLFREGQSSLVALQKQLQSREKVLAELTAKTQNQEALNARLDDRRRAPRKARA